MNSRNPRAKGFKAPLGSRNWTSTREFLIKARGYLLTFKMEDGKPLYRTKRSFKIVTVSDALTPFVVVNTQYKFLIKMKLSE